MDRELPRGRKLSRGSRHPEEAFVVLESEAKVLAGNLYRAAGIDGPESHDSTSRLIPVECRSDDQPGAEPVNLPWNLGTIVPYLSLLSGAFRGRPDTV